MTYYDDISEGYDELHREEQERKLKLIKENIKLEKDDRLLDVGCGSGISSDWDCDVTGIDPSEKLLELAQQRVPHGQFIKGFAEDMPFDDDEFDLVISLTALQNFEDAEKGLSEIKRVGRKSFVLSFMKRTERAKQLEALITGMFRIEKKVEEDKDIIFFCSKA